MSKLSDTLKSLIGKVAPFAPVVASALGGPAAGAAVGVLSDLLLGHKGGSADQVLAAVSNNPDALLKLREADHAYEIELERIAAEDRKSARAMRIATGDWVPGALAVFITLGFFGTLGYILSEGVPQEGGEALLVMLGALGAAWGQVIAFYFGSSAGSKAKTDALSRAIK